MRLGQSLTRKLVFCGALIAAMAATYPAAAQYYYGCPAGFYLVPGYGCIPYASGYAYSPYDYAPYYAGVWGGGWGGWHHSGWGGSWGHGG
jgi:hypothetical protein